MRFDPEDYAFTARYETTRLLGEIKGLGKQGLMRLLSLGIILAFAAFFWWQNDHPMPHSWFPVTRWTGIYAGAALVIGLIVFLVAKLTAESTSVFSHASMVCCLLATAGLLLPPIWLLAGTTYGYSTTMATFLNHLHSLTGQPDTAAVEALATGLWLTSLVWRIAVIVGVVLLLVGVVLLIVWLVRTRALGWAERRFIQAAIWYPPLLLLTGSLGMIYASQVVIPNIKSSLDEEQPPLAAVFPDAAIFHDWSLWLSLGILLVTLAIFLANTARLSGASLLLARLPAGNACRFDAIGLVVDKVGGEQRLAWPEITAIGGRQRQSLPGPELVVTPVSGKPWSVPLLYLDVLPGTIDSAIRAQTQDQRTLDLTALDQLF